MKEEERLKLLGSLLEIHFDTRPLSPVKENIKADPELRAAQLMSGKQQPSGQVTYYVPDNSPLLPENQPRQTPPSQQRPPHQGQQQKQGQQAQRPPAPSKPVPSGSMASNFVGALFGGSGGQMNASSIREANAQVEAMHARITDLEKRVSEQMELLERRRQEAAAHFRHMSAQKDHQAQQLRAELEAEREAREAAEARLTEKDFQIGLLLNRCSYLDQAASYAPIIDQLSQCLKNAFVAPSKVAQIRPNASGPPASNGTPPTNIQAYLTGVQKPNGSNSPAPHHAAK